MQITDETTHKRTISATLSQGDLEQLVAEAVAKRANLTLHAWHEREVRFDLSPKRMGQLGEEVTAMVSITVDHMAPATVAERAA